MSLFRDLGRRAEEFKRQATDAARESAPYQCADCGETLFTERETCPECGSEAIRRRQSDDAEVESTDENATPDSADDT